MRVSTANSFDTTVSNLARRQSELVAQQERLSTGKRVLRASDDPVAATLAESAQNRLTRVQGDLRAMEASRASLAQAESGLGESVDLIQKARELMIAAGNGGYSQREREDIARQLVGLREQMFGVANLKDNAGRTLFGGLGGEATPFDSSGPSGVFQGQRGQQAAGNTSLPQSLDGNSIWMQIPASPTIPPVPPAVPGTTTIFKVMQDTIDALGSGVTDRTDRLARALTELDAGLDRVSLARGYAGEMLNRADSLESLLDTRTVAYEREKSQLEDLDLIKGISDFQNQQVGMEAALKSYAQIQRLSLFEFVR
jgi:flagellar hook-associated protein 3 FlgL